MNIFPVFLASILLLLPAASLALDKKVVDVPARDTAVRLLIEGPDNPKAVVAIFAGGKGVLEIQSSGRLTKMSGNFAVRTRYTLHRLGLATAVVDAPADMLDDLRRHRGSAEYTQSIQAAIRYLKNHLKVPVWLHGTSRGTSSVAGVASNIKSAADLPDGIVLSSSVFRGRNKGFTVFDFYLEKITGPVLIMHHKEDSCAVTPPDDVGKLAKELKAAAVIKTLIFEGGEPRGRVCNARHYHGFNGIEDKVIADMAAFVLKPQ